MNIKKNRKNCLCLIKIPCKCAYVALWPSRRVVCLSACLSVWPRLPNTGLWPLGAGTHARTRSVNPQHAHQPGHTIFVSTLGHMCKRRRVPGQGEGQGVCVCVVGLQVLRQQLFRRPNCAKSENLTKTYFICGASRSGIRGRGVAQGQQQLQRAGSGQGVWLRAC